MTTAADMVKQIERLKEQEITRAEREQRGIYLAARRKAEAATRKLYDSAGYETSQDGRYIDRAEAHKYSRLDHMERDIRQAYGVAASQTRASVERHNIELYMLGLAGWLWVYGEGYSQDIRRAVRAQDIASAVYNDISGRTFDATIRERLTRASADLVADVTRAVNRGDSYARTARAVRDNYNMSYNNAIRIVRTEGGRVYTEAHLEADERLVATGAEVKRRWVAAIDDRTRAQHADMDGQTVYGMEDFETPDGFKAQGPGMFGVAHHDINCRCEWIDIIDDEEPAERRIRGEGVVDYQTYRERFPDITLSEVRESRG